MRPVNLIPPEERRGSRAPTRTGPIVYIVVGALVVALAGVAELVLTDNQIANRKTEIARLHREDAVVRAHAQRLVAYTRFRELRDQRVATVTSLADSRFDWERVMRELSRIIPADVWLTNLTATSAPGVSLQGGSSGGASSSGSGSGSGLRASAAGPALEITGCAKGQVGVAGFVTALKDIEGVTRVGVQSSSLPSRSSGAGVGSSASGGGSGGGSGSTDCRTRDFVAQFQIVAAFDAAPIPTTGTSAETASATTPATGTSTTTSATTAGG
jgi:Tfp pilus assembly protein PilN